LCCPAFRTPAAAINESLGFRYARATSVANALELLAAHGDKAKVLSGGQSLMPAMNLRLISPELIVDIGELAELRGIAVKGRSSPSAR
jgi:carbon-monoxide dehydrogenase medium subunit